MKRFLFLTISACLTYVHAQVTVLNGASFRTDQPVAAGSWATAFGAFAGVTNTQASDVPLPKTLGGVTVTVDGIEAPLYFVSATQLNFLIPGAATAGLKDVSVRTAGATLTGRVRVVTTGPGLFTKDNSISPPRGAVLNQDSAENTQNAPARRGQVVQIFATGPGAVSATVADGANAPATSLVNTRSTPQVFIGGVSANVQFSGLAPNLIGLWQINAFVPEQPFVAGRVPVRVFMDGVDSNEVSIFVAP